MVNLPGKRVKHRREAEMSPRSVFPPSTFFVTLFATLAPFRGHSAAADNPIPADLILTGGKVVTVDAKLPEAEALAILDGEIIAVGSANEIGKLRGESTQVIDCRGKLVLPGFHECHGHLLGIGRQEEQLNLVGTRSEVEIAALVKERAAKARAGEWILGRGWDQNDWEDTAFPTTAAISAAAPRNPVLLTRIDGHAAWANDQALKISSVDENTRDPSGGQIIRGRDGRPSGVFIDAAISLVSEHLPPLTREEIKTAMLGAIKLCQQHGITTFHDAGCGAETVSVYQELLQEKQLGVRIYVMLYGSDHRLLQRHFELGPQNLDDGRLTIRAIKLMADGALGSRGAALFEPYDDAPDQRGLLMLSEDEVFEIADDALQHGFQVCTHAIGDRANRVVFDAYERASSRHPESKDHRFRVEHAQILDEADIPRFAAMGVIASMQAVHCTSDMPWVPARIGEARAEEGAYVWQKLLKSGAKIANGSDAPVEDLNPLLGVYAAVTRQDVTGKPAEGWFPDQRMTREQALASFTSDAAYAGFGEKVNGSIQVGKQADLVVLSRDILTCEPRDIPQSRVETTILAGEIVYQRPAE
jgi:predicted amidohydrolase YtcJ